mmetsp:Transcript_9891/g.27590  ORF Transcript_9891/g.27590 Transcript_9891/m.27590 type:complete len:345 (-) Transcript_9891:104-1138(-)
MSEDEDDSFLAETLWEAARDGKVDNVKDCLRCLPEELLDARDASGWSALHFAAHGGSVEHIQVIKALCEALADANVQDFSNATPLHIAAQFAEPRAIEVLTSHLADRNARNDQDLTPFDCANGNERRMLLTHPNISLQRLTNLAEDRFKSKDFTTDDTRQLCLVLEEAIGRALQEKQSYELFLARRPILSTDMACQIDQRLLDASMIAVRRLRHRMADSLLIDALREVAETVMACSSTTAEHNLSSGQRYRENVLMLDRALNTVKNTDDGDLVEQTWATEQLLLATQDVYTNVAKLSQNLPQQRHRRMLERDILTIIRKLRADGFMNDGDYGNRWGCNVPCQMQ